MPQRFRKRCLNAYPIRRERSQNYDNGTAHPGFFSPQGQSVTLFSEQWGEYTTGEPSVVAAANWTFSGVTTGAIVQGLNQITQASNVTPSYNYNAHTANIVFNANKQYQIVFSFSCNVGGAGTTNMEVFAEDDGTGLVGYGAIIQADNLDGNFNVQMKYNNANIGALTILQSPGTGTISGKLVISNTKQMTFFNGGVQAVTAASGGVATGSKKVTMIYAQQAAGNNGALGPIVMSGQRT